MDNVVGLILIYLFPPGVLLLDGFIKFVWHKPTISALVWSSPVLQVGTCVYLGLAAIALILHFGFKFWDPISGVMP